MNVAVCDCRENNQPHARHIHIGVANEKCVFFMQVQNKLLQTTTKQQKVVITAMKSEDYLIQGFV